MYLDGNNFTIGYVNNSAFKANIIHSSLGYVNKIGDPTINALALFHFITHILIKCLSKSIFFVV